MIKQNQRFLNGMLVFFDILMLFFSFVLAWYLRFRSGLMASEGHLPFITYFQMMMFVVPIFIFLQYLYNLYTPQ